MVRFSVCAGGLPTLYAGVRYANIMDKATNIIHRRAAETEETRQYGDGRLSEGPRRAGAEQACHLRTFSNSTSAAELASPLPANRGESREACIRFAQDDNARVPA